jgi:thioredoxin reductase
VFRVSRPSDRKAERRERKFLLAHSAETTPAEAWDGDPLLFETSVPGVFAAGDVRAGANRRVAAAVGEGSAAVYSIHRYLETV